VRWRPIRYRHRTLSHRANRISPVSPRTGRGVNAVRLFDAPVSTNRQPTEAAGVRAQTTAASAATGTTIPRYGSEVRSAATAIATPASSASQAAAGIDSEILAGAPANRGAETGSEVL